ncbi:MAG: PAS domain S-box protein [Proteobacteria bacterium]|nr:PAS domain S-box protein [Pseudomonadota bacterium]
MNSRRNRRILVIDDNHDIHNDIRRVLNPPSEDTRLNLLRAELFGADDTEALPPQPRREEYVVESAYQGIEGLELVQKSLGEKQPYAMSFVDMRMPPGWDGLETIEQLWRVDPNLQVVICTAYSDYPPSKLTERLGRSDRLLLLRKPFDSEEISQLAQALCQKWSLQRESERQLELLAAQSEITENRLEAVVECSADAILSIQSGMIQSCNAAAERLLDYSARELCGRSLDCLVAPEYLATVRTRLDRIDNGESVPPFEAQWLDRHGRRIEVSIAVSAIRNHVDEVVGKAMAVRNVGEQKAIWHTLREAREAADAWTWAKDEYVAAMHRDTSAPLDQVIDMLDALLETELDDAQRAQAQAIRNRVLTLAETICDVLHRAKSGPKMLD